VYAHFEARRRNNGDRDRRELIAGDRRDLDHPSHALDRSGEAASPAASPQAAASPVVGRVDVEIVRLRYRPNRVEVPAGTTVTWTNSDVVPHTVTARGDFDSGRIDQSGTYQQTFPAAGVFWYECLYHKDMVGRVVVNE